MARRHHYKRRSKEAHEIDVTTFLNLMVVLVPFLLITAVFSRLTIVELNVPSSSGGPSNAAEGLQIEVIVRENGIEIGNGKAVIAAIPKVEDEYDLQTLSDYMVELKNEYPEKDDASVLMEAQIPYDYLIQVMDTVRAVQVPADEAEVVVAAADVESAVADTGEAAPEMQLVALFSDISVGDAP